MKKILTFAVLSGLVGSVAHPTNIYAETNGLADVISTIQDDTNKLPIEKVKVTGSSVSDLRHLLKQKRKAISKKIAEVTDVTKPKPKTEDAKTNDTEKKTNTVKTETNKETIDTNKAKVIDVKPSKSVEVNTQQTAPTNTDGIQFNANGLLVEQQSSRAQSVVNGLLGIPGHSNGAYYHQNGLDAQINNLSTAEAIWVIHRIEGAGFGQTGDGYAGYDTAESHKNFVNRQINRRFGGSVHALLRAWGTYSYGGY